MNWDLIPRNNYLDFLIRNRDLKIIKVITGVRRCGKSTLFTLFKQYLLANAISKEQIIDINFESIDFDNLLDYKALHQYILDKTTSDKMHYIFLDEIQHVDKFERVVNSLFLKDNLDIYITGSNAYFMSGELATLLTGRYVELNMLPLSFKEYVYGLEILESKNTINKLTLAEKYNLYINNSSFPFVINIMDRPESINEYLQGIYNTILVKDVMTRLRVNDVKILESITKYLFANVGSLLSPRKIANTMTSAGRKVDPKTVERYLQGLKDSLLIYQANRYNIKGKELLKINSKYYIADVALRYLLTGNKGTDTGHMLENIVYLELIRRGYKVY
ncbi:MAG: ATP-binding protein, partial [Selenomonadales bacterium]|nr:ATP-binding protein [Selenomonadales bacterium]